MTSKIKKPLPDDERLCYKGTADQPDIKIFVSHRIDEDSFCIDNSLYIPIRCGAVYDERKDISMLGDDTGDNISEKRCSFNEYTVLYWAWKNVKADYYGLCHYRRYLSFSQEQFRSIDHKIVYFDALTESSAKKCGLLNREHIQKDILCCDAISSVEYDMILDSPGKQDVKSSYEWWIKYNPNYLNKEIFEALFSIIKEQFPEYAKSADEYKTGTKFRGFNCFILRKELFASLCTFLFGVLFELEKRIDTEHFSSSQKRFLGYSGEWLYSIWLYHQKKRGLRIKEKQLVTFLKTAKSEVLPLSRLNQETVTIVISEIAQNFADIAVWLQSLIETASLDKKYRVIILHQSENASNLYGAYIEAESRQLLLSMLCSSDNITLSWYDPKDDLLDLNDRLFQDSLSEENYYPFLAAWIFKDVDKIIFLNSKTIVRKDLSLLYNEDINDFWIAGAIQLPFQMWLNGFNNGEKNFKSEAETILKLQNIYDYISSDVLLMNLKQIRSDFSQNEVIMFLKNCSFTNFISDGINFLFDKKKKVLPQKWNKMEFSDTCLVNYGKGYIPESLYQQWEKSEPCISNMGNMTASPLPLFSQISCDYWRLARKTPFYEFLLERRLYKPPLFQSVQRKIKNTLLYRAMRKIYHHIWSHR